MRPEKAEWMTNVDLDILEFLQNPGNAELAATPLVIGVNVAWKVGTVREHVIRLRDHGLLEYEDEDNGVYRLSETARRYLAGELDPEELEAPADDEE